MDKKTGYLLLLCGLALLAASSIMMWKTFYGTMAPPQVFDASGAVSFTSNTGMTFSVPIPPQVNRLGNLSLAAVLLFFLAMVGGRVAAFGVRLINGPPVLRAPGEAKGPAVTK